jgi:hypothetical protein
VLGKVRETIMLRLAYLQTGAANEIFLGGCKKWVNFVGGK